MVSLNFLYYFFGKKSIFIFPHRKSNKINVLYCSKPFFVSIFWALLNSLSCDLKLKLIQFLACLWNYPTTRWWLAFLSSLMSRLMTRLSLRMSPSSWAGQGAPGSARLCEKSPSGPWRKTGSREKSIEHMRLFLCWFYELHVKRRIYQINHLQSSISPNFT